MSLDKLVNAEKQDTAEFEKEFNDHVNEMARGFRQYGQSEIADYAIALAKALFGVLLSILTSPILAVSSTYRKNIKNTFFAGPETDASRKVQEKLGEKFINNFLSEVRADISDESHGFNPTYGNGSDEVVD